MKNSDIYMTGFSVLDDSNSLSSGTKYDMDRVIENSVVVALNQQIEYLENEIIRLKKDTH